MRTMLFAQYGGQPSQGADAAGEPDLMVARVRRCVWS